MRTGLLIAVIICFLSNPSAGQPRLAAPNGAFSERLTLDRAYAEATDTDRSSGRRFLRSFGGGLLGAGIGGGLGALIGPVAEEELYSECSRGIRDCEGEVHIGPIGVRFRIPRCVLKERVGRVELALATTGGRTTSRWRNGRPCVGRAHPFLTATSSHWANRSVVAEMLRRPPNRSRVR